MSKEQGFTMTPKEGFNAAYAWLSVVAICFIPFFRWGQGREGFGLRAFLALILMLTIGSLGNAPEMFVFAAVWLMFVTFRRLQSIRLLRKGAMIHSQYWGSTTCRIRLPGCTREGTGRLFEIIYCLAVAYFVGPLFPVLSGFCVIGAVALFFTWAVQDEAHRRQMQSIKDAQIQNSWLAVRYREEMNG